MKKIIITYTILLTLIGLMLQACQPVSKSTPVVNGPGDLMQSNGPAIKILAVESFLADIAQNVAGDRLQIETLMPVGIDPHAYEPTPQDVIKIAESQVLIINGAGFEDWLESTILNAGGERTVIEASMGLARRSALESEEAVVSQEEITAQICADLSGEVAGREVVTGSDFTLAVDLHEEDQGKQETEAHDYEGELFSLVLNLADGRYAGFVKYDVAEDGRYIIAIGGGNITVTDANGAALAVEETLTLDCSGLSTGVLLDLEPGEYTISLDGLAAVTTPLFVGPAGNHHHEDGDPHFWLDPLNVVKYVQNIRNGLITVDPEGKDIYTRNAAAYIAQLNDLDAWIKQQVAAIPQERRMIVTNHESFGYFADRYGFQIIGTIVPSVSTGSSPSAQQMARLIDHIRETGTTAIFLETGSNPRLAEQIAQETGIKVVSDLYTHSITGPNGKAPTYIDMIRYNVNRIVETLK